MYTTFGHPRDKDMERIYGISSAQQDQAVEFYDRNNWVFLGCFYLVMIFLLGNCFVFGAYFFEIYSGQLNTVDGMVSKTVEVERPQNGRLTLIGYDVDIEYQVGEVTYQKVHYIDADEIDEWQADDTVILYYNTQHPENAYVEKPPFRAIDVDYVQHLLRRLVILSVIVAVLWYIMFSNRYRTPLEWLRHPFRRT